MFITNGHLRWCPTLTEPCSCKTSGYVAAVILATATAILEFWGSKESGSLSLLGDAWHVTSDVLVYMVAIVANVVAMRAPKDTIPLKRRWAIRNANLLIVVALITIVFAGWRVFHPREILTGVMITIATVGLVANVLMYLLLRAFRVEHEHGYHHDHLHDTTLWHTAADTGISLAVVLMGLLMAVFPSFILWHLDSLTSISICFVLIIIALKTKRVMRQERNHLPPH